MKQKIMLALCIAAIAGGYAWAKYRNVDGRVKYIPFATYAKGKIDTNHWVEFIAD